MLLNYAIKHAPCKVLFALSWWYLVSKFTSIIFILEPPFLPSGLSALRLIGGLGHVIAFSAPYFWCRKCSIDGVWSSGLNKECLCVEFPKSVTSFFAIF
jgi:hypothetical protein